MHRESCTLCEGEGRVLKNFALDSPGRPEVVPCPLCVERDQSLYGTAFVKDGRVIDPTTVEAPR